MALTILPFYYHSTASVQPFCIGKSMKQFFNVYFKLEMLRVHGALAVPFVLCSEHRGERCVYM